MRHAIARVQTSVGHAVGTGGVSVCLCGGVGNAAASLGDAQHLRRPCLGAREWGEEHAGWMRRNTFRGRIAALDPAAAHERLNLLQHLRTSAAMVGSTDGTLYTCLPRLHRWCAAAAALAIASWALLLVHLTG